jgi:hypothetical protein
MQTVTGGHTSTPPGQQTQVIRPVTAPQPASRAGGSSAAGQRPADPPTLVQPAVSAEAAAEARAQTGRAAEERADGAPRSSAPEAGDGAPASAVRR